MPLSAKEYGDAMMAAHRAGNATHAAMLAKAYEEAKAREAGPAAPPREEGFLDQVKNAMVGNITTGKAMAQGIPGVGTWTDELAGKVITALHGGDEEQNRKDYTAPVEAMPAGRRFAAELAGGVVGSAPLGGLGVLRGIGAATALGAASGAGSNQEHRMEGAAAGAAAGALGGVLAPVIAGAGSAVGRRIANGVRSVMGKPTNPYIGRGGLAAQRTLQKSVDNAAKIGGPQPTPDLPLLAQPAGTGAAVSVLAGGDDPAAAIVGAAKAIAKDDSALKGIGSRYADEAGLVPMSGSVRPDDIIRGASSAASGATRVTNVRLKSPVFEDLMENSPDVKRVYREMAGDIRFLGVPDNNPTKVHYVKTMLAKRLREARKNTKKPEVAGRLEAVHDEWTKEMNRLIPGYADISMDYAKEAGSRTAQKEAVKLAGSEKKFVPVEPPGRTFASILPEFISGSMGGVQMRGTLATTVYAAQSAAKAAKGAQARKLVEILTEKDPKKIEMALRMLRQDLTGKPFRWPMMYQGPSALQAWARDEEAR